MDNRECLPGSAKDPDVLMDTGVNGDGVKDGLARASAGGDPDPAHNDEER